jgi:hypothetical protein
MSWRAECAPGDRPQKKLTTSRDADWVVKLIDVYPDEVGGDAVMGGYQLMIAADIFRGRYRETFAKAKPIAADTPLLCRFALLHVTGSPANLMTGFAACCGWCRRRRANREPRRICGVAAVLTQYGTPPVRAALRALAYHSNSSRKRPACRATQSAFG